MRPDARIVNYADDLVICCRHTAYQAMDAMQEMMGRLKLTVNEAKTRVCSVPEDTFDFLGYTFGRCYSWKDGKPRIGTKPSKKRVAKVLRAKHKLRRIDYKKYSDVYVDKELGLVRLTGLRRSVLWANA